MDHILFIQVRNLLRKTRNPRSRLKECELVLDRILNTPRCQEKEDIYDLLFFADLLMLLGLRKPAVDQLREAKAIIKQNI